MCRFVATKLDRFHPELLSILSGEAVEMAMFTVFSGDGNEDTISHDDRAAIAGAGEWCAPFNVLLRAPFRRQASL